MFLGLYWSYGWYAYPNGSTHIRSNRFIGRKGTTTQNVLVICNFNMEFIYACAGWEEQAHDTRILYEATGRHDAQFPHPPPGSLINCLGTSICIYVAYVD